MVSAVVMDHQQQQQQQSGSNGSSSGNSAGQQQQPAPQARRLSLSLEAPASASPFPSPSSSFLPPPTPGAHEFAMKPPPASVAARKASANAYVLGLGIALGAGGGGGLNNHHHASSTPPPSSPLANGGGGSSTNAPFVSSGLAAGSTILEGSKPNSVAATGRSRSSSQAAAAGGMSQKTSYTPTTTNGSSGYHSTNAATAAISTNKTPAAGQNASQRSLGPASATNATRASTSPRDPGTTAAAVAEGGPSTTTTETSLLSLAASSSAGSSPSPAAEDTLSQTDASEVLSDPDIKRPGAEGNAAARRLDENNKEDGGSGASDRPTAEFERGEGETAMDLSEEDKSKSSARRQGGNGEMGNSSSSTMSAAAAARQQQQHKQGSPVSASAPGPVAPTTAKRTSGVPPPSSFPLALAALTSTPSSSSPSTSASTSVGGAAKTPTTPSSTATGTGTAATTTPSRPPSSYFPPDLALSSSRPAPPSPALSATKNARRMSRPGSGVFTLNGSVNGGSGSGGNGGGGLSRTNSLTMNTNTNAEGRKRQSGLGLGGFMLSSPAGSPTATRFFASAAGSGLPTPPGSAVSAASTVVPHSPAVFSSPPRVGEEGSDSGSEDEGEDGDMNASVLTLGQSQKAWSTATLPASPRTASLFSPTALASTTLSTTTTGAGMGSEKKAPAPRTMYIKIRDYAFPESDERFRGLGADCPKVNKVGRLNRRLRGGRFGYDPSERRADGRTISQGSWSTNSSTSEDADDDDVEEEEDEDDGGGWFRMGLDKLNWGNTSQPPPSSSVHHGAGERPSQSDLDRNFLDPEYDVDGDEHVIMRGPVDEDDDEDMDIDREDDDADEPLYPGIYRALFAFEPEGTAEVRLVEDQLVRVVKRGGGVGWAVVEVGWRASKALVKELKDSGELDLDDDEMGVVEGAGGGEVKHDDGGEGVLVELKDGGRVRQGLVPESYLTPVRLDGWVDAPC